MKVGGKYNWKGQRERLVYTGRNWSGNGYWHQFEKVGEPGVVWCEVVDADLAHFEESEPAPASPLPEAAEPVAWQHLKAYGYAPGNYMNKCHTCGKVVEFVDKRAITCRPCAEARHAAAPSPVAQAPAQAGEVAQLASKARVLAAKLFDGMKANSTEAFAPLLVAIDRLAAFATQPLAAPVQAWEAKILGQWTATQHPEHLRSQGYEVREVATPQAQPVLAPVVREPLTEGQIDDIAASIGSQSLHATRLHELGGITRTILDPMGVIEFARAIERHFGIQATTGEQSHGN